MSSEDADGDLGTILASDPWPWKHKMAHPLSAGQRYSQGWVQLDVETKPSSNKKHVHLVRISVGVISSQLLGGLRGLTTLDLQDLFLSLPLRLLRSHSYRSLVEAVLTLA